MAAQAFEWLRMGGPAMAVLVLLSVVVLTIIIVKVWEFFELQIGRRDFVEPALAAWHAGRADQALAILGRQVTPLAEVMAAAILGSRSRGPKDAELREQVAQQAADRLESVRGLLRTLEVSASLAPLLGLLGTVLGMIKVFRRLQEAGDRVDPSILSGGLWEALLTTAAGLAVAIAALAAFHWLERRVERLHRAMESTLTRIFTRPMPDRTATIPAEPVLAPLASSENAY